MTTETEGLPELAGRVARLEGAYERVDRQLDSLDRRIESLTHSVDRPRSDMNGQINKSRSDIDGQLERSFSKMNASFDRVSRELRILFIVNTAVTIGAVSAKVVILAIVLR